MDEILGREHPEPLAKMSDARRAESGGSAGSLALENVTRIFSGQAAAAVSNVSFSVAAGELLALVGASGSGKTTTLRIAAGYEQPDSGRVILNGIDITRYAPQRRDFGMVFQHYALFPHMPVEENVAFGLAARGISKADRLKRARTALETVGLGAAGKRGIQSLSGGEQQRVALARALVIQPKALLLDEPLSNLDPTLRTSTRDELRAVLHRAGVPALFVTHDQEDAFAIADRIAVMQRGKILQTGTPQELYDRPVSRDVAAFIGRATIVPIQRDEDKGRITFGNVSRSFAISAHDGNGPLAAVLRPEALRISSPDNPVAWKGEIISRRFVGSTASYLVQLDGSVVIEVTSAERSLNEGERVGVELVVEPVRVVPA